MIKSDLIQFIRIFTNRLSAEMTDHQKNAIDFEAEDYEAIEQAVLETERGRWFLAEYAARNRRAETTSLLTSLTKLERAIGSELQYMNNSTESFRSHQRLAYELETLIKAIGLTEGNMGDPIENLAQQLSANTFTLAHLADSIRDRMDELALIDLPAETVIKLSQASQQIITATAHQNQLCRQVEALAKIVAYLRGRLEDSYPQNANADSENFSAALSIASLNSLREKVAALQAEE